MLDQEAVGVVGQGPHQLELVRGEAEAVHIIGGARLGIGHEDLGRGLLDDRAGDAALERVLRALRGEADDPVALADRLLPILDPAHENVVVQRLPAFVDDDDRRGSVQPFLDPVEEVHHGRRAHRRIVEDRGHVEADRVRGQIGLVPFIVEQPGALAVAPPGPQPRPEIGGVGAVTAAEQFGEMPKAPVLGRLRVVGVHGILDPRHILDVGAAGEQRQPVDQELAVDRIVRRAGAG